MDHHRGVGPPCNRIVIKLTCAVKHNNNKQRYEANHLAIVQQLPRNATRAKQARLLMQDQLCRDTLHD